MPNRSPTTVHGPSGAYFPGLMKRLGIAAQIKPKEVTRPGGYIGVVVTAGEAEMAFQQIVELMAVPGIAVVGPIRRNFNSILIPKRRFLLNPESGGGAGAAGFFCA